MEACHSSTLRACVCVWGGRVPSLQDKQVGRCNEPQTRSHQQHKLQPTTNKPSSRCEWTENHLVSFSNTEAKLRSLARRLVSIDSYSIRKQEFHSVVHPPAIFFFIAACCRCSYSGASTGQEEVLHLSRVFCHFPSYTVPFSQCGYRFK